MTSASTAGLRNMSVRRKLLLLSGGPVLVAGTILLVLFIWANRVQTWAYGEALAWERHSQELRDLDWATRFYVDSVADTIREDPLSHQQESANALARARFVALSEAARFSARERANQARLDAELGQLVAEGERVHRDRRRLSVLTARYHDVKRAIQRRVAEEEEGSRRAVLEAEDISERVRIGGAAVALVALLAAVAGAVIATRGFALRVATLEEAAARVAAGDLEGDVPVTAGDELGRLAGSLNTMVGALRRQRDRQFEFLAGVAHDLRNPLSAMHLSTDVLLRKTGLPPEPTVRKSLALINRQIVRLGRMVDDLLDAARIEAGDLELELRSCDLTALARDVIELYEGTSPHHELRLSAPDRPVTATCDPTRVTEVLDNLVSNAIKYSPAGGPVDVEIAGGADAVVLRVIDAGVGIDSGAARVIFEPFRRASATRGLQPGIGLGLWICRRIAAAHGGRITVSSEPGRGSRFELQLPRRGPGDRPQATRGGRMSLGHAS